MACVTSHVFEHDNECEYGKCLKSLKVYGLNDKFTIECAEHSNLSGCSSVDMQLDVHEAQILKSKIEEFLVQNA